MESSETTPRRQSQRHLSKIDAADATHILQLYRMSIRHGGRTPYDSSDNQVKTLLYTLVARSGGKVDPRFVKPHALINYASILHARPTDLLEGTHVTDEKSSLLTAINAHFAAKDRQAVSSLGR